MEQIGGEVERELRRRGSTETAAVSRIAEVWPDAVGAAVARNAWPLHVARDGTLHVATSSSTWAFELDRLSPQLMTRLTGLLGNETPSKLRFRPGPVPEPGEPQEVSAGGAGERAEPAPEVRARAASVASQIEDPELRALAERAARASLAKNASGRLI